MRPKVYIIAGPNGVGKTTFAREFLPYYADCKNFVNADLIAQGMSPFSPETAAFRAGRLMVEEIALLAKRKVDFGFETTLSGRSHLNLIQSLKNEGNEINFFFLWVPGVELALSRVRRRVMEGGHNVPEEVVCRRFARSIGNFRELYIKLADSWMLFDNSGDGPKEIAFEKEGDLRIMDAKAYAAFGAQ